MVSVTFVLYAMITMISYTLLTWLLIYDNLGNYCIIQYENYDIIKFVNWLLIYDNLGNYCIIHYENYDIIKFVNLGTNLW